MRSRQGLFLVSCLSIVAGLLWSYSVFVGYFAENGDEKFLAESYARKLERQTFEKELAEARLRDLSQEVASILPADADRKLASAGYELKNLASTVREPAAVRMDLSAVQMESAKRLFGERKYREAADRFEKVIDDYPTSPLAVESYFLLAESSFLLRDERKVIEIADLMVSQYPDNDLTGFVLLRLGQINERNNRAEEAAEIYRIVGKSFKNQALSEQARRMAKALDL